jgi:hypothetical protein
MNEDLQHLKLLSVFHYVVAGIAAIFGCFPIFHLAVGISVLTGGFFAPDDPSMPFPFWIFGLIFTLIPAAIILVGWALAISVAVAGYFLGKQQNYMFCMVMAGISCIFTPFGTVLGIFTLIVLMRPSVKTLFNYPHPAQA